MDADTTLPTDPLWRQVSQLRLLLPLIGVNSDGHHAKELEVLYHVHQHLSLLTCGSSPTLNPDLRGWGPGTIDAVSQAFINNRGLFIWGTSKLGQPSNKEQSNSKLTLFLYFLVSLTLSPDASNLFRKGGACAASADVPDTAFYRCMGHAWILLANFPGLVKLTRKSNLVERGVNLITLEIPDSLIPPPLEKISEHEVASVVESPKHPTAAQRNGQSDLLRSKWATTSPATSSHRAVAFQAGEQHNNGAVLTMLPDEMLPPIRNPARRGTDMETIKETHQQLKESTALLVPPSVQKESFPKSMPLPTPHGPAIGRHELSKPVPADVGERRQLRSLVDGNGDWQARSRLTPRSRIDIARWLENMEKSEEVGELDDNGDSE